MPALHVRNVPESVLLALRERAARHGQSMQEEVRQILQAAATAIPPQDPLEPVRLATVRTAAPGTAATASTASTWRREEIYGDTGR